MSSVIASLVGCAATVTQTSPSAASSPSPTVVATTAPRVGAPSGAIVVIVTGSPAAQKNDDWSDLLEEWRSSLADSAKTAKMPLVFAKDEIAIPSNGSILVRLTVNEFKYVSRTKLVLLAVLAGHASMDVDAQYIELPTNKTFGFKKFNTSSSVLEGPFSAVTPQQVQTVSALIVKDVVSTAPAN